MVLVRPISSWAAHLAGIGSSQRNELRTRTSYSRYFLTYFALTSMLFIGLAAKLSPCSTK